MSSTYFMYLRKSSESEDRQTASIPAQERELSALAQQRGLKIVGEPLTESFSARHPGRPVFNQMLERLRARRGSGILCWHLDRLARNPLDGGQIMQALGDGTIREIVTPNRVYSNTDDKLMMSIEFGMATKYTDDLSRNVRRGQRQSLAEGRWPYRMKLGYTFDRNLRKVVADPERFSILSTMWQMRAAGATPMQCVRFLRESKLRGQSCGWSSGKLIPASAVYRILKDPFYAGLLRAPDGELLAGEHPAMVSVSEFTATQCTNASEVARKTTAPGRHQFAYAGLVRCDVCGSLATTETKVNRQGHVYFYYHCSKRMPHDRCPEGVVSEHLIDAAVNEFYQRILLPPEIVVAVECVLRDVEATPRPEKDVVALRRELSSKRQLLDRLRELRANDEITAAEFSADRARLGLRVAEIEEQLRPTRDTHGGESTSEKDRTLQFVLNQATFTVQNSTPAEKFSLAQSVFENLSLRDRKVLYKAKKPFSDIAERPDFPCVQATNMEFRTWVERTFRGDEGPTETMQEL